MWRALGSTQIIRLIWPGFPKTILKWNEKALKAKQNDNQLIPGNKPENETARSGNEINRQIITFWQFINELYFVSDGNYRILANSIISKRTTRRHKVGKLICRPDCR